jgi:hypothetical protein
MERKPKKLERGRFQGMWRPESKRLDIYQYDETTSPLTFYPDLIEDHKFSSYAKAEDWFFNKFRK